MIFWYFSDNTGKPVDLNGDGKIFYVLKRLAADADWEAKDRSASEFSMESDIFRYFHADYSGKHYAYTLIPTSDNDVAIYYLDAIDSTGDVESLIRKYGFDRSKILAEIFAQLDEVG